MKKNNKCKNKNILNHIPIKLDKPNLKKENIKIGKNQVQQKIS